MREISQVETKLRLFSIPCVDFGLCLLEYLEETLPPQQERNQDGFVSRLVLVLDPK